MGITLKRLTKRSADMKKTKQLYKNAFPADERAPFFLLMSKVRKDGVDFWGIYNGSEWVGLMYVVSDKDIAYVFHFAIDDKVRGKGFGSGALEAAKAIYKDKNLFLAIEELDPKADNYAERVKRKSFYQRCGFEPLGYKLREATVMYDLLGTGGSVRPEQYKKLMNAYMGKLLSKLIVMEIIE